MLMNNFRRLCCHEKYGKSFKIIIAEANDWTKADRYCKDMMSDEFGGPGIVKAESNDTQKPKRYGVYTDPGEKVHWKTEIEKAFMSGAVCYAQDFVTCGDANEFQRQFEEEARFFRVEKKLHQDVWEKDKFIITGKGNGGRMDDRICAFGMVLAQRSNIINNPLWQNWAEQNGVML